VDAQEVADLVRALEDEVNNDGFDQFFYNNASDNPIETIQALEAIGAFKMADIVKRAAAMFPGGMPPKERFARPGVLLAKFPDAAAFNGLDEEFCEYPDDLSGLLARYMVRLLARNLCGWDTSSKRTGGVLAAPVSVLPSL
jgi:hypothetical protein